MTEYRDVYAKLLKRIESGEFPIDSPLPSISALMDEYSVNSLSTIRAAQQLLVQDGLLRTEQGRGAFVIATESPRKIDPRSAIADAMTQLQRAQSALIANAARKVTIDLDEDLPYFVLSYALREYSDRCRFQAADEPDADRAAWLNSHADEADRLYEHIDNSLADPSAE